MAYGASLLLPGIALAFLGWLVPRLLALVFPEGVKALFVLAFVAAMLMEVIAMGVFLCLYLFEGLTLSQLFGLGLWEGLGHLATLGVTSALIWAPVLVLSVAGLPKHWVDETW